MTDHRPLDKVSLNRVDEYEDLEVFWRWLGERRPVLGVDTETGETQGRALQWYRPGFEIRLAQFGDANTGWTFRADRWGGVIEKVLRDYEGQFVGHNFIGFDCHALKAKGFTLPKKQQIDDTLLMSKIVDSSTKHGLKDAGDRYFGSYASLAEKKLTETFKLHGFGGAKSKGLAFSKIGYEVPAFSVYASLDTILTARLWEIHKPVIDSQYKTAYERELGAWWVTFEHEHKGLYVDVDYANQLRDEWVQQMEILASQLRAVGIDNPRSKAQKVAVLMEVDGWEPEEYTKSGEAKLDKATLEKMDSEIVSMLLEYNRLGKWISSYVDSVIENNVNNIVYPSFNPLGAQTGRQSASNPPVQQLPSHHEEAWKMRKIYVPRPGEVLYGADYAAQENRLLAHFSKDPALLKIINEGLDIHQYTAAQIYDVDYDKVTKAQRGTAKTFRYAASYGAGTRKLSKTLQMPEDEVRAIAIKVDEAFIDITKWKKEVENIGRTRWNTEGVAWVESWGGRRVIAQASYGEDPKFYTLVNYCLQASGADILKEALNRIAAAELSEYIYLPIHDELQMSVPPGKEGEEIANEIAKLMTMNAEFIVPMPAQAEGPYDYWTK